MNFRRATYVFHSSFIPVTNSCQSLFFRVHPNSSDRHYVSVSSIISSMVASVPLYDVVVPKRTEQVIKNSSLTWTVIWKNRSLKCPLPKERSNTNVLVLLLPLRIFTISRKLSVLLFPEMKENNSSIVCVGASTHSVECCVNYQR